MIRYFLIFLARAVQRNIGLGRFCTNHVALGPYCHDLGPIFPLTSLEHRGPLYFLLSYCLEMYDLNYSLV